MKTYTWINEVINANGEVQPPILDPKIGRKLTEYLQPPKKSTRSTTSLALVRDHWKNGKHESREWAFVKNGKLATEFSFTRSKVPKKFQNELDCFLKNK